VAVKQIRVSDLSGRQGTEEQFAKLIVHEHPQYQGPIILDVLPEELGELPNSEQYVSIEVIGPGERSGQRAVLSVDRFNQLAAGGDMNAILQNAVADQQPQRPAPPRRRGRATSDGQARAKGKVEQPALRTQPIQDLQVELVKHAGVGPLGQAAPAGRRRATAEFLDRQQPPGSRGAGHVNERGEAVAVGDGPAPATIRRPRRNRQQGLDHSPQLVRHELVNEGRHGREPAIPGRKERNHLLAYGQVQHMDAPPPPLQVMFIDSAGVQWRRDTNGNLDEWRG
jgi:hypothetical protein